MLIREIINYNRLQAQDLQILFILCYSLTIKDFMFTLLHSRIHHEPHLESCRAKSICRTINILQLTGILSQPSIAIIIRGASRAILTSLRILSPEAGKAGKAGKYTRRPCHRLIIKRTLWLQ